MRRPSYAINNDTHIESIDRLWNRASRWGVHHHRTSRLQTEQAYKALIDRCVGSSSIDQKIGKLWEGGRLASTKNCLRPRSTERNIHNQHRPAGTNEIRKMAHAARRVRLKFAATSTAIICFTKNGSKPRFA